MNSQVYTGFKYAQFYKSICIILIGFLAESSSVLQAASLDTTTELTTPANIVDALNSSSQVGHCIAPEKNGGFANYACTAQDFRITNIDILNVDDGCFTPDDYMRIDLNVQYNTHTANRYDIGTWFYRGPERGSANTFNSAGEDANTGYWCTRIQIAEGINIYDSNGVDTGNVTSVALDLDQCADAVGTNGGGTIQATLNDLVLPCRDVGDFFSDDGDSGGPDGIVDVAACTSWDNNAGTVCNTDQYQDHTTTPPHRSWTSFTDEIEAGTGSKCNCSEFDGSPAAIPNVSVDKVCSIANSGVITCTITVINEGFGLMLGASAASEEGFYFVDNYDSDDSDFVQIVSVTPDTNAADTASAVHTASDGPITFYPGDIAGVSSGQNTSVLVYELIPEEDAVANSNDIENTVCGFFFDTDSGLSTDYTALGLCDDATITTPISLSSFMVSNQNYNFGFVWTTASETNNLGFNVYAQMGQSLYKLNNSLIPSKKVNSLSQLDYQYVIGVNSYADASEFYLEDVDILGKAVKHGPFKLNKLYGDHKLGKTKKTNWGEINKQNTAVRTAANEKNKGKKKPLTQQEQEVIEIGINNTGIYRVYLDDLENLGFDRHSLDAGKFELKNASGDQVQVRLQKHKNALESYLEFIGEKLETMYTNENVYQLYSSKKNNSGIISSNNKKGKVSLSDVADYYWHTEKSDEQTIYVVSSSLEQDPWLKDQIFAIGAPGVSLTTIPLSDVYDGDPLMATLSAKVLGGMDISEEEDHFVQLIANGSVVEEVQFDAFDSVVLENEVQLSSEQSELDIEVVATGLNQYQATLVYTDEIAVTYPRKFVAQDNQLIFDSKQSNFRVDGLQAGSVTVYAKTSSQITHIGDFELNASGAIEFVGLQVEARYFVVGKSRTQEPRLTLSNLIDLTVINTDHLVIANPLFINSRLDDYLEQRNTFSSGSTAVINVEDIFTNLNGGVRDAEAIKKFIKQVGLKGNLKSVLFIGGDVYDYNDYLGLNVESFVPTLYAATGEIIQFAPVDALYGDLDNDQVPDIMVGRLPVRSEQELENLLGKMELFMQLGSNKTAVIAADKKDQANRYDFVANSDDISSTLETDDWAVNRVYLDNFADVNAARNELFNSINDGTRLTIYSGHTSITQWSWTNLFSYADVLNLNNSDSPGAYFQWGCYNTYFTYPIDESLSNGLLVDSNNGAALVIGSSTLTNANAEAEFAVLLQQELSGKEGVAFGQVLLDAKQKFAAERGSKDSDILLGITLLGDPLLQLMPVE